MKQYVTQQGLLNDRYLITYHHQDGEVSADEFLKAIEANCGNKTYDQLPPAFKSFITGTFKSIDVDGTSKGHAKIKGRKVKKDKNALEFLIVPLKMCSKHFSFQGLL